MIINNPDLIKKYKNLFEARLLFLNLEHEKTKCACTVEAVRLWLDRTMRQEFWWNFREFMCGVLGFGREKVDYEWFYKRHPSCHEIKTKLWRSEQELKIRNHGVQDTFKFYKTQVEISEDMLKWL